MESPNIRSILRDKVHFLSHLRGIQWTIHNDVDHEGLRKLEKKIQIDLSKILYQDELLWYQSAKVNYMVDDDWNTKFYNTRVVQRRKMEFINMLKDIDNNWIEDGEEIKSLFQLHFKNLFTTEFNTVVWLQTYQKFNVLDSSVSI